MEWEDWARPSHPCLCKWERAERIGCVGVCVGGLQKGVQAAEGPLSAGSLVAAGGAGAEEELGLGTGARGA